MTTSKECRPLSGAQARSHGIVFHRLHRWQEEWHPLRRFRTPARQVPQIPRRFQPRISGQPHGLEWPCIAGHAHPEADPCVVGHAMRAVTFGVSRTSTPPDCPRSDACSLRPAAVEESRLPRAVRSPNGARFNSPGRSVAQARDPMSSTRRESPERARQPCGDGSTATLPLDSGCCLAASGLPSH